MTTRPAGALLRGSDAPQKPTFLELFFDLAYVFALSQLSHELAGHLTWNGAFQNLILLLAMLQIWISTTWITDRLDPVRPTVQLLISVALVGSLILAVAVPQAFGRYGLIFAGVYVAMHVGRAPFLVLAMRGHELQRIALRTLFWSGLSAVPWILGAITTGTARELLWTLAAALDYAGLTLNFPLPSTSRAAVWESPAAAEHLAERYRHLIIIALGELILVSGQTFSGRSFVPYRTAAFLVEVAAAALLLRIYMYRSGQLLSAAAATARPSGRPSRWLGYVHLVMVAGIIATSVGAELVIAEPLGRTAPSPWDLVILGGPALFVVGRVGFEYAVFTRVSLDRPIGVLVLAALIPVALLPLSPLLTAATAMTVLAAIAFADAARAWRRPRHR